MGGSQVLEGAAIQDHSQACAPGLKSRLASAEARRTWPKWMLRPAPRPVADAHAARLVTWRAKLSHPSLLMTAPRAKRLARRKDPAPTVARLSLPWELMSQAANASSSSEKAKSMNAGCGTPAGTGTRLSAGPSIPIMAISISLLWVATLCRFQRARPMSKPKTGTSRSEMAKNWRGGMSGGPAERSAP